MAIKQCKECGEIFETKTNTKFCSKTHYRTCRICGKQFPVRKDKLYDTSTEGYICSPECGRRAKGLSTKSAPKYECICKVCGKKFMSKNASSYICYDQHKIKCANCGKLFDATREQLQSGKATCSKECRYALAHETYQANYGADLNPENHSKMIEKYENTMLARYGVRNIMQLPEVQKAAVATRRNRYGTHMEAITAKKIATCRERYGVDFVMQDPDIREKSRLTCLEKYGVDNYAKSSKFLLEVITDPSKADVCKEFRDDPRKFISTHYSTFPTLRQLSEDCGIRESSVGWIIDKADCSDVVSYTFSAMEDEVFEFLKSTLPSDVEIVRNTFKIITPYELDIFIPEYNLAIECNPTITHNSTIPGFGENDEPKPSGYHKMKTDMCEKKGIFLFHIFGYEWTYRKAIIKSMLTSLLGQNLYKIYARNTEICLLTDAEAVSFLEANHRQGGAHSSIRLGLKYEGTLVSVMTFSKMRNTIGKSANVSDDCYELVRFCNLTNTTVVGGASKLFKYFVKKYEPLEIRSFSDRAHTRGNLYSTLGFKFSHISEPGYMWVNIKTDRGYARNNAQKKNIASFLNDPDVDLTKTETQIMAEHNYVQVFDSGVILWIWKGENL